MSEDNMNIFSDVPSIEDTEGLFTDPPTDEEVDDPTSQESTEDNNEDNTGEQTSTQVEDPVKSVAGEQTETEEDADDSPSLFSSLATLLKDKGLISSELSDNISEEDFVDMFKNEITKNELSDLNDLQKKYLQDLRDGVPEETVKQEIQQTSQLDSITDEMIESDENLRQRIIYNDFLNRGYSEEKALKYMKRSVDLKEDLADAKDALQSIKEHTKERFDKEKQKVIDKKKAKEQEDNKRIENIKKKIKETDEIIKNFKISDNIKEQVQKNMFDIVDKNPDTGEDENSLMKYARENKDDFELKLYYLYTITKGFQNFDVIEKSKNSKVISNLEKAMRSNTRIKDNGDPIYKQDPDSYGIDIAGHEIVTDY